MAKLTLNTIGSRYGSIDALNDNSNLVEAAFENTLSRDGTGPNNMEADLDMDSNSIINVDEISASQIDVNSLLINGVPVAPTGLSFYGLGKETQVATANQTVFTLGSLTYVQGINNIQVYVDGVYQNPSTYAETSTTSITFDAGLHVGAVVDFVLYYMDNLGYTVGSNATQYNPAGVGAVATNVQTKLRESISVKDFGAVADYDPNTSTGTNNFTFFGNTELATTGAFQIPMGNYRNGGTGGVTRSYVGDGVVYTGAGAAINNKYQRIGNIGGNPTKNHFSIACIPRCTTGVFSLLDDATHTPMNVTSVTQPDPFVIRVNYIRTASKINTFIVGPDDALAPYGVVCGGDVGTAYANIVTAAPFSAKITLAGGVPSLTLNDLWAGGIAGGNIAVTKPDASIVRIAHTSAVTNDPPVCSYNSASVPGLYPVISFFSDSVVDVMMTGDAAGFIEYDGAAWVQSASQNLTAPVMTWTVGNRLRIDHGFANTTNRVPIVTGHKGVYLPQVYDIGTTWFEVEFFDYAGVKVTTQNTNMKIWYRRQMPVPCVWNDTMDVVVRRGLLKVPSALYSGVAGNNFWVCGDMEI